MPLMRVTNWLRRFERRLAAEQGIAMIPALTAVLAGTAISLGAWQAAHNDIGLQNRDRWSKRAFQATQDGVADFTRRLSVDSNYWTYCDDAIKTTATNDTDVGTSSTKQRRWYPLSTTTGFTDQNLTSQFTIDLIPANGAAKCSSSTDRTASMIDTSTGAFRIRVTGRAGPAIPNTPTIIPDPANPVARTNNAKYRELWREKRWRKRSVVVDYRRRGFLDYAWFTDYENQDPVLDQTANYAWANNTSTCQTLYYRDGRKNSFVDEPNPTPDKKCVELQFSSADRINGPFHTNDSVYIENGSLIGRPGGTDRVEISDGVCPLRDEERGGCGDPVVVVHGTLITGSNAPALLFPETGVDLELYATAEYGGLTKRGVTTVVVNDNGSADITNQGVTTNYNPAPNVLYVSDDPDQPGGPCQMYNQLQPYPLNPTCGTVEIKGTYSRSMTVATQRDIVINGDLLRRTGAAYAQEVIGLIADDFVRVRHYLTSYSNWTTCTTAGDSAATPLVDRIQGAILALNHSFMVDHYACGGNLGFLSVDGVIAQRYRGAVGAASGNIGYKKDFDYDNAFRYKTPPHFLSPSLAGWRIARFREQVPGCVCEENFPYL